MVYWLFEYSVFRKYQVLEAENKAKYSSESKGEPVEIFHPKVNNAA